MACGAKDRTALCTLKPGEPGLSPGVCSSPWLPRVGQPEHHRHGSLGVAPSQKLPTPLRWLCRPHPEIPAARQSLGPGTREADSGLGRLLVPGTGWHSEGPDTSQKPQPWSQAGRGRVVAQALPCSVAEAPPRPHCVCCSTWMGPALSVPLCGRHPALPLPPLILASQSAQVPGTVPGPGAWQRAEQGVPVWDEARRKLCCWYNQMEPSDLRPKVATPPSPVATCISRPQALLPRPPPHCCPWFLFTC